MERAKNQKGFWLKVYNLLRDALVSRSLNIAVQKDYRGQVGSAKSKSPDTKYDDF